MSAIPLYAQGEQVNLLVILSIIIILIINIIIILRT
jgi:hypothetical protein